MFCGQCGTKNEEGSKFCESCGARLVMPRYKSVDHPGRILHSRTYDDSEETLHDKAHDYSDRTLQDRAYSDSERSLHDGAYDNSERISQNIAYDDYQLSTGYSGDSYKSNDSKKKKKRKLFILLFVVLLLVAAIVAGWIFMGIQSTRAFNDAVASGNRYLLAENLDQAEAHFLRAIEISPREVEPYLRLADIYVEQDEIDRALEILEQGQEAVAQEDRSSLEQREEEIREQITASPQPGEAEEPMVDDNEDIELDSYELVWIVEPTLEFEMLYYCFCYEHRENFEGFFTTEFHGGQWVNPRTGEIAGEFIWEGDHGFGLDSFVYCPEQNAFGNATGFALLDGLLQANDFFELSPWRLSGLHAVERIDSSLLEQTQEDNVRLTPEALTGEYAVLSNGVLVTDFIFGGPNEHFYRSIRLFDYVIAMQIDNVWGFIDANGEIAIPFIFEDAILIDEYSAFAKYNGRYGILDIRRTIQLLSGEDLLESESEQAPDGGHLTQVEAEAMFREGFSHLSEDDFEVSYEGEFIIPYDEWTQYGTTVFTEELGGLEAYLFSYWIRGEDGYRWIGMTAITFDGREISTMARRMLE